MLGIRLSWSVVYPQGNFECLVEEELTNETSRSTQPKQSKEYIYINKMRQLGSCLGRHEKGLIIPLT